MGLKIILIFSIFLLIFLISYQLKKENTSNFTNFKFDYTKLLKNNKIDMIENENVDIVCSGPSSKNIKLKSNIIILVNDSILNKQINKKTSKKTIWLMCKMYQLYKNFKTQFLDKINMDIDIIVIRWANLKNNNENTKILSMLKNKFPNVQILNNTFNPNEIKAFKKQKILISCGIQAIDFTLKNNAKNIYISGIEMGNEPKYSYNTYIEIKPTVKLATHLNEDKKYFNQLNKEHLNKLIPLKNSGLFKYLKNI